MPSDQDNSGPTANGVLVHCQVNRQPQGDRISVYVGLSPERLQLVGIIWTGSLAAAEIVRRLEEPGFQAELDKDGTPVMAPVPPPRAESFTTPDPQGWTF